jgi:hypothetical protein
MCGCRNREWRGIGGGGEMGSVGARQLCGHYAATVNIIVVWSRSAAAILVSLVLVLLSGCTQDESVTGSDIRIPRIPSMCGVPAAMSIRQPEAFRERPPACSLPSVEEIARSCAIHDLVTSTDYRAHYDNGELVGSEPPIPEYTISQLKCSFTTQSRNQARCRFMLSFESEQRGARQIDIMFQHEFWQDHGPAHHMYGTRWSPMGRCDVESGQ